MDGDELLEDDLDLLGAGDEEGQEGDEGHENADEPDGGQGTGQEDEEGDGRSNERQPPQGHERSERVAGRASARVTSAVARATAAEQRASDLAARLETLERSLGNRAPDPLLLARQQQEEAERLAVMSPLEQTQYLLAQSRQQTAQQMSMMQRQQAEQLDKLAFDGFQASSPIAKRFAAQVEKTVQQEAAKGVMLPRKVALSFLIGEHVLANGGKAAKTQRAAGAARVQAQTTRRVTPSADVSRNGAANGGSLAALEKRLANVAI